MVLVKNILVCLPDVSTESFSKAKQMFVVTNIQLSVVNCFAANGMFCAQRMFAFWVLKKRLVLRKSGIDVHKAYDMITKEKL